MCIPDNTSASGMQSLLTAVLVIRQHSIKKKSYKLLQLSIEALDYHRNSGECHSSSFFCRTAKQKTNDYQYELCILI